MEKSQARGKVVEQIEFVLERELKKRFPDIIWGFNRNGINGVDVMFRLFNVEYDVPAMLNRLEYLERRDSLASTTMVIWLVGGFFFGIIVASITFALHG